MANTQKFKTVTTNLGRNAVAIAHATGSSIKLTHMAVGDGNGQSVEPNSAMTALVHEVYRGQINDIVINSEVQGEFTAELLIPQSTGGFFIREVGLFFEDGTMFAIGNTPLTEKTELSSGAATDLLVRMIIRVLDAGTIEIFIDPAQVLATRDYVDRVLDGHEKNNKAHTAAFQDHNEDDEAHQGAIKAVNEAKAQGQIIQAANVNKATDLNTVVKQGKYYFPAGMAGANKPNFTDFILEVVQAENGKLKQFAYDTATNQVEIRTYTGSRWTDWLSLAAYGLPSLDFIEISLDWKTITENYTKYFDYIPLKDGYMTFVLHFNSIQNDCLFSIAVGKVEYLMTMNPQTGSYAASIPVKKGESVRVYYTNYHINQLGNAALYFMPLMGEE